MSLKPRKLDDVQRFRLFQWIEKTAGESKRLPCTYEEAARRATVDLGFEVSANSVGTAARRLGVSCKDAARSEAGQKGGATRWRLHRLEKTVSALATAVRNLRDELGSTVCVPGDEEPTLFDERPDPDSNESE